MKIEEVVELLKDIKGIYGKFEVNERTPKMWFKYLEHESKENVIKKLDKHVRESKFEPVLSDLISDKQPEKKEREVGLYLRPSSGEDNNQSHDERDVGGNS